MGSINITAVGTSSQGHTLHDININGYTYNGAVINSSGMYCFICSDPNGQSGIGYWNGDTAYWHHTIRLQPGTTLYSNANGNGGTTGYVSADATEYYLCVYNPNSVSYPFAVKNKNAGNTMGQYTGWISLDDMPVAITYAAVDVNSNIYGTAYDTLQGIATCDVYINGSINASGVNDYYQSIAVGSSYKITNIQIINPAYIYTGASEYSGTVTASGVSISLPFSYASFTNTIRRWIFGVVNGDNNESGDAKLITEGTFTKRYGDSITFSDYDGDVPRGFHVERYGSGVSGEWRGYEIDDCTVTQPANTFYLEVQYQPTSYSITYNMNGGINNSSNPSYYTILNGLSLADPVRSGYKFAGWYVDGAKITGINEGCSNDADEVISQINTRTIGDIIIDALWIPCAKNLHVQTDIDNKIGILFDHDPAEYDDIEVEIQRRDRIAPNDNLWESTEIGKTEVESVSSTNPLYIPYPNPRHQYCFVHIRVRFTVNGLYGEWAYAYISDNRYAQAYVKKNNEWVKGLLIKDGNHIKPDIKQYKKLKILMIGNSFCYYFPDELWSIAHEHNIEMKICNVYYSGCKLSQHYSWLQSGTANYSFFTTTGPNSSDRVKESDVTLEHCLDSDTWDIISLQNHFNPMQGSDLGVCMDMTFNGGSTSINYAEELYNYIRSKQPNAKLYWQQTWAYQVGWSDSGGNSLTETDVQTLQYKNIKHVSNRVCCTENVINIPSGDAWQLARANPIIGDGLCNKGPNGDSTAGDYYHDGTTGGGQYLNACVWFETLTGISCIGSTWRPSEYVLSEDRVAVLQDCAHKAVCGI